MNTLENNLNVLSKLYQQYPESFEGLTVDGNYLVYNGERTDISEFNIERLINENSNFVASLSVLSPEDIFRIVRLHSEMVTSTLVIDSKANQNDNEKKIEIIKEENPLMKNINITTRHRNGYLEEFITILDSNGKSHMFRNDYNTNIFALYELLKYRHPGVDVTPDELIQEVNRKLYEVNLESASRFDNHDDVSEDFENKMRRTNDPYKDDKMYNVLGNQENDIALVEDLQDGQMNKIITFNNNEHGDLVLESHGQNVNGTDTKYGEEDSEFANEVNDETNSQVLENKDDIQTIKLISTQEFYDLLDSPIDLDEEQRKNVDLYYAYLGDLVLYEDYLLDELKSILYSFRAYVDGLMNRTDELEEEINSKQQEAINKLIEFEGKKNEMNTEDELTKVDEHVKKLVLNKPNETYDNAANASIIQVIAFVIGVSIILTAITLYLVS